jgi:diguanylate cyclase (GGDEF)-like protein
VQNKQIWHESYFNDVNVSEIPQYSWKMISYISEKELKDLRKKAAIPIVIASSFFNPIALIGIWGLYQRRKLKNHETERIRYLATHDGMTGLFNKAFFEAEIKRLNFGRAYPISIIIIDANNLKEINDRYGHQEGDKLIQNIGSLITQTFRTDDVLARIGGDEFAMVLLLTNPQDCTEIAARFCTNISRFNKENDSLPVDVAIGSATSDGQEDLESVIKRADEAMYLDKAAKKSREKRA